MVGPGGLDPLTSSVSNPPPTAGIRGINRLGRTSFGSHWHFLVWLGVLCATICATKGRFERELRKQKQAGRIGAINVDTSLTHTGGLAPMRPKRNHEGVTLRHSRSCRSRSGRACSCEPTYQAHVWHRREGKRIRKPLHTTNVRV